MARMLLMSNTTRHHKISGGYLFIGLDTLAENLVNIYAAAVSTNPDKTVTLDFDFNFLDSVSKSLITRFFRAFSTLHERSNKCSIRVIWTYDYQDEDMEEFGGILEGLTDIPFEFIEVDRKAVNSYAKAN